MPVVVVDIEVVDDGEEEELDELDPVELLTSLYGKTPRIGAVVVEASGKDAVNILMHTEPIYNFGLVLFTKLARWEESFNVFNVVKLVKLVKLQELERKFEN